MSDKTIQVSYKSTYLYTFINSNHEDEHDVHHLGLYRCTSESCPKIDDDDEFSWKADIDRWNISSYKKYIYIE